MNTTVIRNTMASKNEVFDLNLPIQSYNSIVFSHLMSSPKHQIDRKKSDASQISSKLRADMLSNDPHLIDFGQ